VQFQGLDVKDVAGDYLQQFRYLAIGLLLAISMI
jgi:hypothetical protein